jgi:hypothetical protein
MAISGIADAATTSSTTSTTAPAPLVFRAGESSLAGEKRYIFGFVYS